MHFLSPIWFFALATLSIPVVIHLWNIKAGKTLKVGSISLITEASKTNRRSLKLLDILLFITRCLLLALLALFLAAPVWQQLKPVAHIKGWVMLPKDNLKETYKRFKPAVDSLTRKGYEFHYFEHEFIKADVVKTTADTAKKDTPSAANYWALLQQLNAKAPIALPIYLFTPNGISHFKGVKPATGLQLQWRTYTQADSAGKWLAAAVFTADNTIKVTRGNSSPAGVFYINQYIKSDGNADMAVAVKDGHPTVILKGTNLSIPVDTATLKIAIYADKYGLDVGYLKAALSAATGFMGRKAIIKEYSSAAQIPGGQTWLFWLADGPVSDNLLGSKNIFKYETGKASVISSWINTDKYGLPGDDKKIALNKMVVASDNDKPIWTDGFGRQILEKKERKSANIYSFYTHFNPQWNDLVWTEAFPEMMLKLIAGKPYQLPEKFDKRTLTDEQIRPIPVVAASHLTAADPFEQVDVSFYFWLLLVALFITERTLSHYNKSSQNNG